MWVTVFPHLLGGSKTSSSLPPVTPLRGYIYILCECVCVCVCPVVLRVTILLLMRCRAIHTVHFPRRCEEHRGNSWYSAGGVELWRNACAISACKVWACGRIKTRRNGLIKGGREIMGRGRSMRRIRRRYQQKGEKTLHLVHCTYWWLISYCHPCWLQKPRQPAPVFCTGLRRPLTLLPGGQNNRKQMNHLLS